MIFYRSIKGRIIYFAETFIIANLQTLLERTYNQLDMTKITLGIGLMLFVSMAVFAQNTTTLKEAKPVAINPNAPEFNFEQETYDFGTIKQGDRVNYEFKFTNTGKEPLVISRAKGSCGCTVPKWPKEPIMPGEEAVIRVAFNSKGRSGKQRKTVTITSNAKTTNKRLFITGNVVKPEVEEEVTFPERKVSGAMPFENSTDF